MDYPTTVQTGINLIFLWLGFGIVVGMVAKVFLPEGEPKGTFGILVIGVSGSCIGPLFLSVLFRPEGFNPISPLGFAVSVLAALALLLIYRFFYALWKRGEKEIESKTT